MITSSIWFFKRSIWILKRRDKVLALFLNIFTLFFKVTFKSRWSALLFSSKLGNHGAMMSSSPSKPSNPSSNRDASLNDTVGTNNRRNNQINMHCLAAELIMFVIHIHDWEVLSKHISQSRIYWPGIGKAFYANCINIAVLTTNEYIAHLVKYILRTHFRQRLHVS